MHDSSSPCKQVIAEQLETAIKEQNMTRTELAKRMGTSRMVINRLLDLDNTSVTLITLEKAVSALGRQLKITIE